MPNLRNRLSVAGAIAVSLVAFGWTTPAWAPTCGSCTTTSALLPLQGVFHTPPEPCVPAGEDVSLAGEVHVVTKAGPGVIAEIHLNMAGVDGVGQTSGSMYIGTGSNKFVNIPPQPCISVQANFTLETTNGCASVPLPVTAGLCFAGDGTLLPQSSSVSIGGVS
jgi:hypothetical protein